MLANPVHTPAAAFLGQDTMLPPAIFYQVVEQLADAIVILDRTARVRYANRAARSLLSLPHACQDHRLIDVTIASVAQAMIEILDLTDDQGEKEIQLSHDRRVWIEFRRAELQVDESYWTELTLKNIHRQKQTVSRLEKQATTDFLSGLSNRRQFQKLLESHRDARVCVAVIDVDDFKSINDRFGHLLGDAAIRFVAELLLQAFSDAICTARLGGEEFGVIVGFDDRARAWDRFETFRAAIEQTHFLDEHPTLTVSIGLAWSGNHERHGHTLLHQADQALYESKNAGKNQIHPIDVER